MLFGLHNSSKHVPMQRTILSCYGYWEVKSLGVHIYPCLPKVLFPHLTATRSSEKIEGGPQN